MKMFPSVSQATSVGWRNWPSIAGRGGVTRVQGAASSDASFLRPKNHVHVILRVEAHDHVRSLVDRPDPDIVVLVDAHCVRIRPGIEVLADFPEILAVRAEFQQLSRARPVGRSCGVGAREYEDMSFGVDGDPRAFAELEIRRELEEVGSRVKGNLRNRRLSPEGPSSRNDPMQYGFMRRSPEDVRFSVEIRDGSPGNIIYFQATRA